MPIDTNETHHYHHTVKGEPTVNVKVEKNSKGFNYEVTVVGARSLDEAMELIMRAEARLAGAFGPKTEVSS